MTFTHDTTAAHIATEARQIPNRWRCMLRYLSGGPAPDLPPVKGRVCGPASVERIDALAKLVFGLDADDLPTTVEKLRRDACIGQLPAIRVKATGINIVGVFTRAK